MSNYILKDKNNKSWTGIVSVQDNNIVIKETYKKRKLKKWVNYTILIIEWLIIFSTIFYMIYNLPNFI